MSKLDSRSVFIEKDGAYYKFINCKIEPNDGSFYVTLFRDGENSESSIFNSKELTPVAVVHDSPRKKLARISYHSSGCVLYRHTEIGSNYFEPISMLTKPNVFAAWSIPEIEKLDKVDSIEEEDFVININGVNGRTEFTLMVAPWQQEIEGEQFAIRYEGLLSLIVIPTIPSVPISPELSNHFITLALSAGSYQQQAMESDQALIKYHQKLQQTRDLIIYSPNKAGICTLITAVPMRIAPKVKVLFHDPSYRMELVSSKNNVVKFKVKNQHDHVVKQEAPIKGIELCSEL
jgi:hypothetical protein